MGIFRSIFGGPSKKKKTVQKGVGKNSLAAQQLKIAQDCARIVNTTKNPKVFFERYELLVKTLQKLSGMQHSVSFSGTKPSAMLSQIQSKRVATITDFINRYYADVLDKITTLKTAKAKQNKVETFFHSLEEYSGEMPNECVKLYTDIYAHLLTLL